MAVSKAQDITEKAQAQTVSRPVRHYRAMIFQGYVIAAVISFLVLALVAHTVAYFPIDRTITLAIQRINSTWFADLMLGVSWPGFLPQSIIIIALVILSFFAVGLRWEAVALAFVAVLATIVGGLTKLLVARPRPASDLVHVFAQFRDTSFPSGHVLTYVAVIGFVWFLMYILLKHSFLRTFLLVVLGGLVLLVGLSRIYLGEHWASDVIGGYLIGSVLLSAGIYFYLWGKPRFFVKQPVAPEVPAHASGTSKNG